VEHQEEHLQVAEAHHQVIKEDHLQVIEDHQDKAAHHQAREVLLQAKAVHLQAILSIEAHHQAKVAHQVADHRVHQWAVLLNKALETYSETHLIL